MSKGGRTQSGLEGPFPWRGYLLLNALVWLFCLATVAAAKALTGDVMGIVFFFIALSVCFAAVSLFDAFCDRIGRGATGEPAKRRR